MEPVDNRPRYFVITQPRCVMGTPKRDVTATSISVNAFTCVGLAKGLNFAVSSFGGSAPINATSMGNDDSQQNELPETYCSSALKALYLAGPPIQLYPTVVTVEQTMDERTHPHHDRVPGQAQALIGDDSLHGLKHGPDILPRNPPDSACRGPWHYDRPLEIRPGAADGLFERFSSAFLLAGCGVVACVARVGDGSHARHAVAHVDHMEPRPPRAGEANVRQARAGHLHLRGDPHVLELLKVPGLAVVGRLEELVDAQGEAAGVEA
eukprot:CAMPEP_0204533232 /NCGR_PEP_ID=MMETSP0661-20131031/12170_1 /ASSEMBLY_ACC=CAM_ASM_000606 /TAXON_ID=109239 /ORGANISM="Alexandrium margalefi, Strain AMGDE01CS-322" /LENGTH=265 /DNA_ID=CAMNT_0051539557 /DNA_START=206 /DNA_END=1006 /DNA_ORIENTATION=-